MEIVVKDNGKGFALEDADIRQPPNRGFGLISICGTGARARGKTHDRIRARKGSDLAD